MDDTESTEYWKAKFHRLNDSLPRNKRLFSDAHSQNVIESQVKRIKQLEEALSLANFTINKLRTRP
jgi:hypothetical protein